MYSYFNYSLYKSVVTTGAKSCWFYDLSQWAARYGRVPTLQRLFSYSLFRSPTADFYQTPFVLSVICYHHEFLRELIAHGADIRIRDNRGATLLHSCCDAEMVELLVDAGARNHINLSDGDRCTALYEASRLGRKEVVVALLPAGADSSVVDK